MALPSVLECRIVQDLLVGFAADELHPDTRDWVTLHLNRCGECQQALALYTTAAAALPEAPAPSADPGRRLVGRVRRGVWVLGTAVALCAIVTVTSVYAGVAAIRRWGGLPADMPVPAYNVDAVELIRNLPMPALTGCCVEKERIELQDEGLIIYQDAAGNLIDLHFEWYIDNEAAEAAFQRWQGSFKVRSASVANETPNFDITKFRSGGDYYFGWRRNNWLIHYEIPDQVENPVRLRDEMRDYLYSALK